MILSILLWWVLLSWDNLLLVKQVFTLTKKTLPLSAAKSIMKLLTVVLLLLALKIGYLEESDCAQPIAEQINK
jgi:hypothetical protein